MTPLALVSYVLAAMAVLLGGFVIYFVRKQLQGNDQSASTQISRRETAGGRIALRRELARSRNETRRRFEQNPEKGSHSDHDQYDPLEVIFGVEVPDEFRAPGTKPFRGKRPAQGAN